MRIPRSLASVIEELHASAGDNIAGGYWPRVSLARCGDLVRVGYFGGVDECDELLAALADSEVAPLLASIELSADDRGRGGLSEWQIDALVPRGVEYENLAAFRIDRSDPFRHNRLVVADRAGAQKGGAGALGKLCDAAPLLASLEAPSAPLANFFDRDRDELRLLHVDAGLDHAGFIRRLAEAECLPALEVLAWGEYHETYLDDWKSNTTLRADYEAFFASEAFTSLRSFIWRNPPFSDEEVDALIPEKSRQGVSVQRWEKRSLWRPKR